MSKIRLLEKKDLPTDTAFTIYNTTFKTKAKMNKYKIPKNTNWIYINTRNSETSHCRYTRSELESNPRSHKAET